MAIIDTKNFGLITYDAETALEFPGGLPGFDRHHRFVALHLPQNDPLIFLQSLDDTALCFITMPVLAVEPGYRLELEAEDVAALGLSGSRPKIGEEVLCLAILAMREEGPTANLLAPLVVNVHTRKSVQAVLRGSAYSHQQPLFAEEAVACS